ncbi:MAG: hypothetical protein ACI9Y1_002370 [Lentisphaeria bacterium]|jgi:hypothetical protein
MKEFIGLCWAVLVIAGLAARGGGASSASTQGGDDQSAIALVHLITLAIESSE